LLPSRAESFDGKLKANKPKVALFLRLAQMELIKWQQQIIATRLSSSYMWLARAVALTKYNMHASTQKNIYFN